MRTSSKLGIVAVLLAMVVSSFALAEKLVRPRHPNYYRYAATRAAGLDSYSARRNAKITQIGVTDRGASILMVKSPELKVPAIVSARQKGRWDVEAKKLSGPQLRRLGLVSPADALRQAQTHGKSSLFKNVRGKIEFAGASNKGQSYKLVVTPKKPVKVRDPYGMHTITKLNRYVNVNGTGETAQPAGSSSWTYIPRPR